VELSQQQQLAVQHFGSPALVVAGAGSGKTRTLIAKFIHLMENGYDPERILAITFTNKAADEMKTRLRRLTGRSLYQFPWVRTYHSACLQIIKKHYPLLGFENSPQIYQPYQQEKLVKEILLGLNYDKKHTKPVLYQISLAKNFGNPRSYFDGHPVSQRVRLPDVFKRYQEILKFKGAVDFDNILMLTRDLLREHNGVRKYYQDLFQYILVDEYQDTNNLQEELTGLLVSNGNLFCVGDDWQSIYSFRGSNINHFLSFERKYGRARIFRLEQNFRSTDEIVQAANHVIQQNDAKMDKHCFSNKAGGAVELHGFFDEKKEAEWTTRKIKTLYKMGQPLEEIAVLYRTKFSSLAFEQAFRSAGIPYKMMGGKGFFDRKEIMDVICYVTAAVFEKDDVSFERILNIPKRGIGPATIKKINAVRNEEMSLQAAVRKALQQKILAAKLYTSLIELMQLIDHIRDLPPAEAIKSVISKTNYLDYLASYAKGNPRDMVSREENLEELVYAASQKDNLYDFLEDSALIRDDQDDQEKDNTRAVRLSTIHASKGLEYKTVFVIGCEEQLFPHWKSLETIHELEEERRLMYVAMTRAEKFLYLTWAESRRGQYGRRSRFIDEIEEYVK
jgi:DNA helicase II / ATP-dependent DNA helicase PcrA